MLLLLLCGSICAVFDHAAVAQWTRDAKFGAIFMWRTQWTQQKPAQIDRAKVKALEAEAQGYRNSIK